MANTSSIKGFTIIQTNGGPHTSDVRLYYVASAADEILAGDVAKLGGSADANGIPSADLCGSTDVPIGIVVGILNSKFDPVGKMTTGSMTLDLPNAAQIAASGSGYILVNVNPDILMEVECDTSATMAAADIGLNVSHTNTANSLTRTASTVTSPAGLSTTSKATTSTLNFNIRGLVQRPDNEIGASNKVVVGFNRHQFKSVGTTGI